jgi:pyruvate dehydrogenase E2 component (dihydrolipoamide acetyltransferase)
LSVVASEPGSGRTPVPAAPATRRLARELGVDLARVPASGPGGRVTSDDVQRFAAGEKVVPSTPAAPTEPRRPVTETEELPAIPAGGGDSGVPFFELERLPDFEQWGPVQREAVRSIRRKVARKMVASMTIVPHVAHMDEADVTELDAFRRQERKRLEGQEGGRLTLLAFVIKAAVAQLKSRPQFNASLDPHRQEIIYKQFYNVGFAADTDKGLVVPVVKDVDRKNIVQLSAEIERLATRAREGKLEVDDLRGGTFTVTNVGSLGGTGVIPTINYPEVAILGMGLAHDKPVVRDGQVVVRKMLPLTIAFDHRLIDGADAARWMTSLVRTLSDPYAWILEC